MKKKVMLIILLTLSTQTVMASGLINEMQTCQGLLTFLETRLAKAPAKYDKTEVVKVRKGLKVYNQYIQNKIVTPGLLKFNHGDKNKANAMQKRVNAHKKNIVKNYAKRYPKNIIFTDHAMAVNNCAKKALPAGQQLADLKVAVDLMVKFSKMNVYR